MAAKRPFSAGKLFDNNKFVLLFSVLAAIVFWMVITVNESPDSENTIAGVSVSIPTENSVVSELGLDVIDDVTAFKAAVNVTGPAYVVSTLGPEDVAVTASVSKVTASGTYELELRASKQNSKLSREFEISSVSPTTITVTFDYIDTKQFPVIAQAVGASAVEGLVAEDPVVSDSNNATLTFKGSRTNIEKISKVVASAEVNAVLSKTETFPGKLAIYDAQDNLLPAENYTITTADGLSAPDVQISVPISKMKTVPLKAQFVNVPAAFQSSAIGHTLSFASIDLIGPPETIDNISSVSLGEVDFDRISENNQRFEVAPILPDGVKSVDNITTVTVTITGLEKYTVRTYTVSNIVATSANGTVTLSRAIRNVKIFGPKSVLNAISSSDLYAEVDVSGKQAGEHTVSVRMKCKSSGEVWQVGTYTAAVTIK